MTTINYADGRKTTYDSYDEAVEAIAAEYQDAEIGHSGDLTDGGDQTLCWASEADSVNDDGANAIASITVE